MEEIISFLMGHIYWVIVIIGVIYSLFKKRSGAKPANPKMPSFGGGSSKDIYDQPNSQDEDEERDPYSPYNAEPTRMQSSVEPVRTIYAEQGEGFGSGQGQVSGTLERAVKAASARSAASRATMTSTQGSGMSQQIKPVAIKNNVEEIRKAVIWSEILGPPRAKRPYGK